MVIRQSWPLGIAVAVPAGEDEGKIREMIAGVKEPAAFALVGLGMTGLGLLRLRRNR